MIRQDYPERDQYPLFGGHPPSVGVDTSEEAAARIEPNRLARRVLAFIQGTTGWGATCDEVERELGLRHQTASARCRELELASRIVTDPGQTPY